LRCLGFEALRQAAVKRRSPKRRGLHARFGGVTRKGFADKITSRVLALTVTKGAKGAEHGAPLTHCRSRG
jgi:hypothetical protein